jgi:chromosome segregation ATPase
MAITREQIIQAANTLQDSGEKPTMEKIRGILNGGSYSIISPVLREWKKGNEKRAVATIQMPNEAKAAFDRTGADLWQIISTLATEKLTKVQVEAEESVQYANSERDEAIREIERLESILEQKKGEIKKGEKKEEDLSKELATYNMQNQKLQLSLDHAVKKAEELKGESKEKEERLLELKHQNGFLSGELKALKTNKL